MRYHPIKTALCALLAAVLLLAGCVGALAAPENDVDALISDAIGHHLRLDGASDVQQWIDGALSERAGNGAEWYVIALSRLGEYDFSRYAESLAENIAANGTANATGRQRCALALRCAGYYGDYISETPEETIGELGVMSLIFGLHLLNNGGDEQLRERTVETLLETRLEDGGWALFGSVSDIDVTAMAIQALAPSAGDARVRSAVEKALELLSQRQLENGGFAGFGEENLESCAQVITALSSLGIDCRTDSRFIKNGATALDALMSYRTADGGFEHEKGKGENGAADQQALCALVSIKTGAIYIAQRDASKEIEISERSVPHEGEVQTVRSGWGYKPWAVIVIAALCAAACAVFLIRNIREKNSRKALKNCVAAVVIGAILTAVVMFTDIKSADEFYRQDDVAESVGTVTMSITCGSVAGRNGAPADGIILPENEFAIAQGDSVYDLLIRAARQHRIQTDSSGSGELTYISGIANLYEFEFGDLSGWIYTVNGEVPSVGCAGYKLSDGDRVAWVYSLEMGRELEEK